MKKEKIRNYLENFAHEVIKDVAVQTHTDWSKYLEKPVKKYIKLYDKHFK